MSHCSLAVTVFMFILNEEHLKYSVAPAAQCDSPTDSHSTFTPVSRCVVFACCRNYLCVVKTAVSC